jgi:hypothetical protein
MTHIEVKMPKNHSQRVSKCSPAASSRQRSSLGPGRRHSLSSQNLVLLSDLILATGLRHAIVDDDAPAPRPAGASFRMEGGPGGAVRGWLEFASVGELLSFLQRLGVDGRGVEASALFDIADDVAGSHPALSGSVLERMQAGAPMPARPAHPWDRGAFASRPDRAQPPFTAGTAGGGGSSTASSYGGSGGPSAVGADGDMPFLPSQLSGGELAALGPAAQRVVGALLSRVESLEGLLDPAARFEYMAQVAVEPPMRAILDGRLSAADVRAVRAYPISPAAMDLLVEAGIFPPDCQLDNGDLDPAVFFGDGA